MAIMIGGISLPLSCNDEDIKKAAAKKLGIRQTDIASLRVKRQSLDSRKRDIKLVYTLHITLTDDKKQHALEERFGKSSQYKPQEIVYGTENPGRPVVVGAGPCGLFAALKLAEHGYRPLLLERGCDMQQRVQDVHRLAKDGMLNEESNICFGAGGAGAFSDGKLTTRIKDGRVETVLDTLVSCGAPEEIKYLAKPHTGTEYIRIAVSAMIERIRTLGGEVNFGCKFSTLNVQHDALRGITYIKDGLPHTVDTRAMILAIGHSARDTYAMLQNTGVAMIAKPFAIGVRIEHKREFIDHAQYGNAFGHPRLGAAEYRLTSHQQGRGVYTFCMCPGGEVVCSSTEPGGVAVNGMSYYARQGENSNSAVVVSVGTSDFESGALGGVAFQRHFERAAYNLTGGYGAPVQIVGDFLSGSATQHFGSVKPTYQPYTRSSNLQACLPPYVADALKMGLADFGKKLKGFDMPDAVLTGVETRTSSPVRLIRSTNLQSEGIYGLYPAGEGAGYAGGIVSAAVDGIKCAKALMQTFARP